MVLLNTIIPQRHRKYMYKWYYILGSPEYYIPVIFCGHLLSAFEWFSQFTDFFSADFRFSPNQTWISRSYYFRSPTAKIRWLQKKPTNKRVYSNRAPRLFFWGKLHHPPGLIPTLPDPHHLFYSPQTTHWYLKVK